MKRHGFSLVEVLAALVLIGIVLPATMRGVTIALQAASFARHQQEATMLAEQQLNTVLALRDPTSLTGGGTFGDDWPGYRWEATNATTDFGLYDVTVTVTWQDRGRDRSVSLSTLVYPTGTTTSTGTFGLTQLSR